jgi:hypothetical protein
MFSVVTGASDAARSFGKPKVGDEAQGSPPAGQHGLEHWRLTKAKRATKREVIVVATMISRMIGTSVFSDPTEFSVTIGGRGCRRHDTIKPLDNIEVFTYYDV